MIYNEKYIKENEIILDLDNKGLELKPRLRGYATYCLSPPSYTYHWLDLEIKVNVTKQSLFSFSDSQFRDEALYGMSLFKSCQVLLGRSWLLDDC